MITFLSNGINKKLSKDFSFLMYLLFLNLRLFISKKSDFLTLCLFGCSLLILFPFCLGTAAMEAIAVKVGCFWAVQEFISSFFVLRMFYAEDENGVKSIFLSSQKSEFIILLSKIIFTSIQMYCIQMIMCLFWIIFYNVSKEHLVEIFPIMIASGFLFAVASSGLGALIYCTTLKAKSKEILQPILFFPLQTSVLLSVVSVCLIPFQVLSPGVFSGVVWWSILCAYPILILGFCMIFYDILFYES